MDEPSARWAPTNPQMRPEQWRQVEDLYHAAVPLPAHEREAFLTDACAGDTALRRRVESLLAQPTSVPGFLDHPATSLAEGVAMAAEAESLCGRRLDHYEIRERIGMGGMGEVYRARDVRLGRDVAFKIVSRALADDSERRGRFEREARLLALLNHPHIASIYGLEHIDGIRAIVMELVEGETLATKIAQGPLRVGEALRIAGEIADALDAAHQRGIVHRDLKPANVAVGRDGAVKVLDFGLGRIVRTDDVEADVRNATMTLEHTRSGIILGTAPYMSPEQARGQPIDKRTDVWAFGCVVYEMLTGQRAFRGSSFSETLAAILDREPVWDALPDSLPPVFSLFVRRCLQKDPNKRIRDIGDVRMAIEGAFETTTIQATRRRWPAAAALVAALALVAVTAAVTSWIGTNLEVRRVSRFVHTLPEGLAFSNPDYPLVTVAPDGATIVFVANNQLYRRALDAVTASPIRGTEGRPTTPFFSPDGQTVGYWDRGAEQLRTVPLAGGTPVPLTGAVDFFGASWGADGQIVFGRADGIWRIRSNGGRPERLVEIASGERVHGPWMLPDGRSVMFTLVKTAMIVGQSNAWDQAEIVIQSLDSGERTSILRGSDARYVPTGHLLYALDTVVYAVPFNLQTFARVDRPVPVIEDVARTTQAGISPGGANYAISDNSTLVFVLNSTNLGMLPRRLLSVDRRGTSEPVVDEERAYWRPRISPDGTRIVVEVEQADQRSQLWVVDRSERTASPITSGGENTFAVWTPDGRSIIFRGLQSGTMGLYRQSADGTGAPELIWGGDERPYPTDVSRDGVVVFTEGAQTGDRRIRTLRLADGAVSDFLNTPAMEHMAMFSPDGAWLAYVSNESGRDEVYVRPYPPIPGIGQLISNGGGSGPVWAADGASLYYRGASGDLMVVPTTLRPRFTRGRPLPVFPLRDRFRVSGNASAYDITADGKHFIMVSEIENRPVTRQLEVVLNWWEELKRLVPSN